MIKAKIYKQFSNKINHAFTEKTDGDFKDSQKFLNKEIFTNKQVHGNKILIIKNKKQKAINADAIITKIKNFPIAIKTADCQAILIYDKKENIISAIHSGWKGSNINIIKKTIRKLKNNFKSKSENLYVAIGPSLGPCCAEFSNPTQELNKKIHKFINKKNVNFWELSLKQLTDENIKEENIEILKECTKCNINRYYSHRNKEKGRMLSFIELI